MRDHGGLDPFDAMLPQAVRWVEPSTQEIANTLLDGSDLPEGSHVLDVCAGTGPLVVSAAERGYRVKGVDAAPLTMTYLAGRLLPYPNGTAEVMDATALTYPTGSFDAAFSVFGVTILGPGTAPALAEMRRVVRPGGTVALVHWSTEYSSPYFRIFLEASQDVDDPAVRAIAQTMYSQDEEEFARTLTDAGLVDVRVEPVVASYSLPAAEDFLWEFAPFFAKMPAFRALSPAQRARQESAVVERVRRIEDGRDPLPSFDAHVACAMVPDTAAD